MPYRRTLKESLCEADPTRALYLSLRSFTNLTIMMMFLVNKIQKQKQQQQKKNLTKVLLGALK